MSRTFTSLGMRQRKRANIKFENARSCAVSTRFQQYIDILLKELQVSPYRKLPNPFAELFSRYEASDYRGVYEEYERVKAKRTAPLKTLPLDTQVGRVGKPPIRQAASLTYRLDSSPPHTGTFGQDHPLISLDLVTQFIAKEKA